MGKLTGFVAGAVLTFGMGAVNAGEAPEILGAADYQAMSTVEMSSITGENRRNKNVNRNNNTNISNAVACGGVVANVCPGRDAIVVITLL